MSRAQAGLLDQLVIGVTREHVAELQRAGRSREQRVLERVRMLLAGEPLDVGAADVGVAQSGVDGDLDYRLEVEHLGVIARGEGALDALRALAVRLDRRLLAVAPGGGLVWAWLGGQGPLEMSDLEGVVAGLDVEVCLAVGEPARGIEGWRVTHRQAQEALLVSVRRPRAWTRYADVALLAAALKDEVLARALTEAYIAPLVDARGGGEVLLHSLRAYLAAGRSVSSTAAALGVSRKTVESRVDTIKQKLGRTLQHCPAELEVALLLDELAPAPGAP
jgi:hypothetical protein